MKNCSVCGGMLEPGDLVCKTCGTKVVPEKRNGTKLIFLGVLILLVLSAASGLLLMNVKTTQESPASVEESVVNETVIEDVQIDNVDYSNIEDADLVEQGITEYDNGNYDDAIGIFQEALDRDLEETLKFDTYFHLADSYYYKDAYEDAIINYHKALEIKYDYLTTVYLAQTYFLVDDPEQADKYFDEALKMDEERPEAYVFYAEYLYYTGDLDKAEENALIADKINPEDLYPVELLVYIYFDKGMNDEANTFYKRLSENDYPYIERVTEYINQTPQE